MEIILSKEILRKMKREHDGKLWLLKVINGMYNSVSDNIISEELCEEWYNDLPLDMKIMFNKMMSKSDMRIQCGRRGRLHLSYELEEEVLTKLAYTLYEKDLEDNKSLEDRNIIKDWRR